MKFYDLDKDDNYEDAIDVGDQMMHIGTCPMGGFTKLNHGFIWKDREGEKGNIIIDLPSLNIGDFVATFGYTAWMITDRVAQLFKEQGFTGYELRPVRINKVKRMKKGAIIPNLWQLVITGWGGVAPPETGLKVIVPPCEFCGHGEYSGISNPSFLINPNQWDGSDFFKLWPLGNFIFITERVKRFIEENGLKGCIFKEPKDINFIRDTIPFSPNLLGYGMPEARAKEIEKTLGFPIWQPPEKGTEKYKIMREELLKVYKKIYEPEGTRVVYLEDEDGYLIDPKFD